MERIFKDAHEIETHFAKSWDKTIMGFVERYKDNMMARQVLPVRDVGASVEIDVVTTYERQNEGAAIVAKGVVPEGSAVTAGHVNHPVYQVLDGFLIHEKDIKVDPNAKARDLELVLRHVHRKEDDFCFNGQSSLNVNGIVNSVPTANKITKSTNHGAWDGSDTTIDIHADLIGVIGLLSGNYDPAWILGNRTDILYLYSLDSERQPYWKTIAPLFGKSENDDPKTWLKISNHIAAGKVYVGPVDPEAGELVVSENPYYRVISMQRGGNYPIEVCEWVTPEIHDTDAYGEIATG